MDPVRFGILACSSVARRRFLPALACAGNARLERLGSRDPAKAAQFAREYSCRKFGSYEEVLTDPDVDAVYVSTPPGLHAEWVCRAADAGKHVWCEKPAFPDLKTARSAVDQCRRAGVRLVEGYIFLHHPQHARVRELLAANRLGEPRFFASEFTYPRPPEGDIRLQPSLYGGVFHDSAGYPVAAALAQMPGQPVAVFCQTGLDPAAAVDNTVDLWVRFSTGASAQMHVGFGAHYRSRYSILGTKSRIELLRAYAVPPPNQTVILLETDAGEEQVVVEPADQFRLMIEDFANELRGVRPPSAKWEVELLRRHAVMDAAARSAAEGRLLEISDYPL